LRGDPDHEKTLLVTGGYDSNNVQITEGSAVRKGLKIFNMRAIVPPTLAAGNAISLTAAEAEYIPPSHQKRTGGWLLTGTDPPEIHHWSRHDILEPIDPGKYFLYTDLTFDQMTRDSKWFMKDSTWNLFQELGKTDSNKLASMAVFFHMRLTRPVLGIILVIMGLSVILRDQNRHVFISAGFCLVICALFYAVMMASKYLGDQEILSPALAAWLPVFLFGPVAFVLFDAVHT
jgi:lipopolysaccharide export system permease protein